MDNVQHILNRLSDENPDAVLFENMSCSLIGVGAAGYSNPVAVYSKKRMFDKLMRDGMSFEDADEYFLSKFVGLWAGTNTPVILDDLPEE